ncbi:MAG: hypothetical protein KDA65_08785 [Planctomycetaceae bacterium]|nr:hypothetical protein [Planctomycetaceae bacterium]
MNAQEIEEQIRKQLALLESNIDEELTMIQQGLVPPEPLTVILRLVEEGRVRLQQEHVWLVWTEQSGIEDGYQIIYNPDKDLFGITTTGFPGEDGLVLLGYCGDFLESFRAL